MNDKLRKIFTEYKSNSESYALVEKFAAANSATPEEAWDTKERLLDLFHAMWTGTDRKGTETPQLNVSLENVPGFLGSLKDALQGVDVLPLWEETVTKILREPKEPSLFLQNAVAQRVSLPANDNSMTVEMFNIGAVAADWVQLNGEYPTAKISASVESANMKAKKAGLQMAIGDEARMSANLDLVGLNIRLANNAMNRFVESRLKEKLDQGVTVIDNSSTDTTYHTVGVDVSGNANYTLDHRDIMSMVSIQVSRQYQPSHVLAHPMTWAVFTQDPIMKAQFYHQGSFGTNFWNSAPQFEQAVPLPYNLMHVPYYAMYISDGPTALSGGPGSGYTPTAALASVYMIDAANALWLLEKGPTTIDSMEDWFKDASILKIRKYFDTATKDGGRAISKALNIRVAENHQALFTVRTLS